MIAGEDPKRIDPKLEENANYESTTPCPVKSPSRIKPKWRKALLIILRILSAAPMAYFRAS